MKKLHRLFNLRCQIIAKMKPMAIQTSWERGHVARLEGSNTPVQKNLVVKGGKYLAYEKHYEKGRNTR